MKHWADDDDPAPNDPRDLAWALVILALLFALAWVVNKIG